MNSLQNVGSKTRRARTSIRRSTEADMRMIHEWLRKEESQGVQGNFLCNWELTKKCHHAGELLVFVDGASGAPVAYQWGGLIRPGILQVRQDMRRKGIGAKLVAWCIREAKSRNEHLLFIQCEPLSSIPFWKKMGFTIFEKRGASYGYQALDKTHPLPADGAVVKVEIRFYPEATLWDKSIQPPANWTPPAVRTPDGVVHLAERAFFFEELYSGAGDVMVEIRIDENCRLSSKAKYPEARRAGVERCSNGYFIDRILPLLRTCRACVS